MKKIGSMYWANSYVILRSGAKIYLEEFFYELEEKMKSNSERITVKISKHAFQDAESMVIKKDNIEAYGRT